MAKNAVVEFVPTWFELSAPWLTFGSILKWCDTAQGELFPKDSSSPVLQQLHHAWSKESVMRSNTARIFLNHNEIKQLRKVRVKPLLQDVGRTSWTCGFRISNASSSMETLVAEVETVMVNTDASHTTSKPIANVDEIRRLITDNDTLSLCLGRPKFFSSEDASGGEVFKFSTLARLSDCDSLGHINNAIYATLAEDFRYYAASQGAYGELLGLKPASIAALPAVTCSVSYIEQARPLDPLDVATWPIPTGTDVIDFNFEISRRGQLIAQIKLGVESDNGASKL